MVFGTKGPLAMAMRVEDTLSISGAGENAPALETVFREHFDEVYRVVGHLLGPSASHSDIDDVTQQVFIAVHRALPKFRGESKLSTWLYAIASNVVLSNLRSWRRQRRLQLHADDCLEC